MQAGGQMAPPSEQQYNTAERMSTAYPQFLFGQTPGYGSAGGMYGEPKSKTGAGLALPKDLKDISVDQIRKRLQDR